MKKIIVLLAAAIICFSATCRAEWPADEIVEKCDPFYLKSMDPAYLRILRNAVYATYGRAFQSEDLKAFFANEDWYSEKPDFSEDMLSAPEKACAGVIKQVEDEQAAKIAALRGKGRVPDVSLLPNIHLFGTLDPRTRELLQSNGFALEPTREEQLFHIYEKNEYQRIPSFVTADLMLQLYHTFFDFSLRKIEEQNLLPQLETLVAQMYQINATLAGKDAPEHLVRVRRANAAYFAVAALLLGNEIDLSLLDPDTRAAVDLEMDLLKKHEKRAESNLFPYKIDYSQFIPRGHYTRSKELKRYFLSMMWLGNTLFAFDVDKKFAPKVTKEDTNFLILRALDTAHLLKTGTTPHGKPLLDLWHAIFNISAFFVGVSDDLTAEQVDEMRIQVYGTGLPIDADPAKIDQVRQLAIQKNPSRIKLEFMGAPNGVQFRFMGQRYTPDSEMLQRLSHFPNRPLPKGLDVMAVLGSDAARKLLFDVFKEGEKWDEFEPRFRPGKSLFETDARGVAPEHVLRLAVEPSGPGGGPRPGQGRSLFRNHARVGPEKPEHRPGLLGRAAPRHTAVRQTERDRRVRRRPAVRAARHAPRVRGAQPRVLPPPRAAHPTLYRRPAPLRIPQPRPKPRRRFVYRCIFLPPEQIRLYPRTHLFPENRIPKATRRHAAL